MSRGRKIKRKTALYKKNRVNKKVAGTFLFIAIVAVLVIFGYIVGSEWSKRTVTRTDDSTSEQNSSDTTSTSSNVTSEPTISKQISSAATNPNEESSVISLFMPYAAYEGKSKAEVDAWVQAAKAKGYNAVAVELKDEIGKIHYRSQNAMALEYGAVSETAADAKMIADAIIAQGMQPTAVLSALKDKTAPTVARGNAYAYDDQLEVNWWDNSAANGGKPWLNPYMQNTRTYIADLCAEVAQAGFTQVMLTNVIFPEKNTEKMNVITETMSREDILKKVVADANSKDIFVTNGYLISSEDEKLTAKVLVGESYEGSAPFVKAADLEKLKPTLEQFKIDDYVVY